MLCVVISGTTVAWMKVRQNGDLRKAVIIARRADLIFHTFRSVSHHLTSRVSGQNEAKGKAPKHEASTTETGNIPPTPYRLEWQSLTQCLKIQPNLGLLTNHRNIVTTTFADSQLQEASSKVEFCVAPYTIDECQIAGFQGRISFRKGETS